MKTLDIILIIWLLVLTIYIISPLKQKYKFEINNWFGRKRFILWKLDSGNFNNAYSATAIFEIKLWKYENTSKTN